jgi:predicted GNAT family acetyltransferase
MQIQHTQKGTEGVFFIEENSSRVAEMTYYVKDGSKMVIDHTEVDEILRGRNVGFELVNEGVEFARREKLKIIPACTFAKSVFDRNEVLRDVLM